MESANRNELSLKVKNDIIQLMDKMLVFRKSYPKYDFPKTSDNFRLSREVLEKGEFNLAVCGKVKNGKSSLINALIGKKLLPVCNEVATSRIFKISHADEEQFFLVYANGNRKEISKEELAVYGSQAEINRNGEQEIENTIAYIQVNTPMDFLPEGVSLVDTPGIGSLYPQHTAITKQSIQNADAALFVMNPTPLEDIEKDFLKEIVGITPGILFVTTKTDECGNDSVEEAIQRNHIIIKEAVGKNLPFGIKMERMSSKLLLLAAQSEEQMTSEFNYEVSGYSEVKAAMTDMVFTILGYYRAGIAYNACVEHYKDVLNSLMLRKETVERATTDYERLSKTYEETQAKFAEHMGEGKRKKLQADVEIVLKTMESDFNQIFSEKNGVVGKYYAKVDKLTQEELSAFNENLGNRIINDIQEDWNDLTAMVMEKVGNMLANFDKECCLAIPDGCISISGEGIEAPGIKNVEFKDKFVKARNEMFLGTSVLTGMHFLVQGVGYFAPTLISPLAPVITPVFVLIGVGSVLWGVISGNKKAEKENFERNKTQLKQYIKETASNCKKQLINVSLADGKYQSLYQGFCQSVREQVSNTLSTIYAKYNDELESMKKTLAEAKKNPQMAMALGHLVTEWSKNKEQLQVIHDTLESIKPA